MGDLKLDLLLDLGGHVPMRVASTPEAIIQVLPRPVEEIKIDNRTLRGVARYQPAPAGGFFDVGHSLKDQSNRRTDLPGYAAWEIHPVMKIAVNGRGKRLFALAFFSPRQDRELLGAIFRGLLDCPCRV